MSCSKSCYFSDAFVGVCSAQLMRQDDRKDIPCNDGFSEVILFSMRVPNNNDLFLVIKISTETNRNTRPSIESKGWHLQCFVEDIDTKHFL